MTRSIHNSRKNNKEENTMRPRKFVRSTALVLVLTAALTVTAFAADPTQRPATKTDTISSAVE